MITVPTSVKTKVKKTVQQVLKTTGYTLKRANGVYEEDGVHSLHNHDFIYDPKFVEAYERGVQASGRDYGFRWRVHVGIWVAQTASRLEGDFVECGVNYGTMSSCIMKYLDWNSLGKTFYLLDTYSGLAKEFIKNKNPNKETTNERRLRTGSYVSDVEIVKRNFSEWENVKVVQGAIPGTLKEITSEKLAYVHIDLNCPEPEVLAAEYCWPKLVAGGLILLDDYAHLNHDRAKLAMDGFAKEMKTPILTLPTGQGLIVKPPVLQ